MSVYLLPGVFFLCTSLVMPLLYVIPPVSPARLPELFSIATISSLALGFSFLNHQKVRESLYKQYVLVASIGFFTIISLIHYFIFPAYRFSDLFFSLFWISVPLVIFSFRQAAGKCVVPYFLVLWVVDIVRSLFLSGRSNSGIAGNQNWHAAFLIVTTPFVLYAVTKVFDLFKKRSSGKEAIERGVYYLSVILVLGCSCWFLYHCHSRGAWLGLAVVAVIGAALKLHGRETRCVTPRTAIIIAGIFTIFISFQAYQHFGPAISSKQENTRDRIVDEIADADIERLHRYNLFRIFLNWIEKRDTALIDDTRFLLWKGSVSLISDHPYIGTGAGRFESIFARYRPVDYFTKSHAAVRSSHPHNTILYIAAVFGIPGFILWCLLWMYPAAYCASVFGKLSAISQLSLLGYLYLFIHGLVDLVLFRWPTVVFGAIFTGILWADTFKSKAFAVSSKEAAKQKVRPFFRRVICPGFFLLAGGVLAIVTIFMVYDNTCGTWCFRKGKIHENRREFKEAVSCYEKGLKYEKRPECIYDAGTISLAKLNDPGRALNFFEMFNEIPQESYAESYFLTASCYKKLGRLNESLPLLRKNTECYPLSTIGWYSLAEAELGVGMKEQARESYGKAEETLTIKQLPVSILPLVLKNSFIDKYPQRIPEKEKEYYDNSPAMWHRIAMNQKLYGLPEATVEKTLKQVEKALEKMKLPPAALRLLLQNPVYDRNPGKIPQRLLKKADKKGRNGVRL